MNLHVIADPPRRHPLGLRNATRLGPRQEGRVDLGRPGPAQALEDPHQTPLLPWRAGQLAKAIHVLQLRET